MAKIINTDHTKCRRRCEETGQKADGIFKQEEKIKLIASVNEK